MMTFLIIFLVCLIIYSYIGYPITIILISKFARPKNKVDPTYRPSVSLLIAAYNEEEGIEEKILNSLELDYPKNLFEIVVVSDGSTDRTDEIVKRYENRGVKLFRVEGRVGKTEARNQAVLAMTSEVIVFSDATAIYQKEAILNLVKHLADETVGMVSGTLNYYDKSNASMGLATKIYWTYESAIKKAQGKMHTMTGAVGCINAFKRNLYHVLPPNIIEDFTEPLMIVSSGHRIVYAEDAISFERTTQRPSQEFNMRVRVIRGGMTGFLYAMKFLNFRNHAYAIIQLIGHKVLRWLVPIFLILLFMVTLLQVLLDYHWLSALFLILQSAFYLIALMGFFIRPAGLIGKVLSIPTYFLVVNAASLKAFYLTMTATLEATWETNVY